MNLRYNSSFKKLFIILIAIFGILAFLIIISFVSYRNSKENNISFEEIYNDNSRIISQEDYNIKFLSVSYNGYYERFSKFNGIDTLYKINAGEDVDILINSEITFKSGNFKIVLVLPDGEIKTVCEFKVKGRLALFSTKEVRTTEFRLPKGTSYIKVVGLNARGAYNIKVSKVNEDAKVEILENN
ncbi:hypothetical protein ABG79_02385 [Caloramator mitchellensis]|uniref:Uncharacterized protein n=1 Tax=Caloramator mitchellensis TaxID=908809 RepID=A0A0R3JQV6_CALMK|nr:hypothetical protein [Caloramator mitchellensis]KRQ85835.1 hypothetical protein ABG79_02385 [Caloramator mitchellensis]